ncbi:hypothetical protein HYX19_02565 [Candidatus Woesearchaeota archaeon]|nr:hypothetical protein [Candidatus Woesearchaeota archaeon]
MPIIGFNLNKLLVEKNKPVERGITVNNNLEIKDIVKAAVEFGGKAEEVLRFDFEFSAEYNPEIGKILIAGDVLYIDKEKEIKRILEEWKKTKIVEPELFSRIMNNILVKCNIKALNMALEVNLPPHLTMPLIVQGEKTEGKEREGKAAYIG